MWRKSAVAVKHFSVWVLLVSLISAAAFSMGGRLIIANLTHFKAEIEQELAQYGITGVSLDSIQGSWRGLHPLLKIKGASLSIPGRSQALSISELDLSVKLFPSLISADLKLASFHTRIEKLVLVHDAEGKWWLNDIPLSAQTADSSNTLDIHALFSRLPDAVSVDIGQLLLRDQLSDVDYMIQASSLNSQRHDEKLALSLQLGLPDSLGQRFKLLLTGNAERQQVYVEARELNLVRWLQLAGFRDLPIRQALFSLNSWMELERYQLTRALNEASLNRVYLNQPAANSSPARIIKASIIQSIEHREKHWRFDSLLKNVNLDGQRMDGFRSQIYVQPHQSPLMWIDRVKVEDLLELFAPMIESETLKQRLVSLQPRATIHDLVAQLDEEDLARSLLSLKFSGLKSKPHESFPGVNNLDGQLLYENRNAHLRLDSSALSVDFGNLLRDPLQADKFAASLQLSSNEKGLILQADTLKFHNADIQFQGRAWLEATDKERPFLSLRADYHNGNVASTSAYLPVSIMPGKTVQWLDESIQGGEITTGDLLFHGRLRKLSELQNNSAGVFHARFDLDNPQVRFLSDWPAAKQGKGQASFHNLAMDLRFSNVQFSASQAQQVEVSIPNLLRSELFIDVKTKTRADNLIDTLSSMPVLNFFDDIKEQTQHSEGVVDANVKMRFPLSSKINRKRSIQVEAELQDVGLSIPSWMVDFKRSNGRVVIDNGKVSAHDISTIYQGDKALLDVSSDSRNDRTNFHLSGLLNSQNLAVLLPDYLQQPISGKSRWDVEAAIANKYSPQKPLLDIKASSNLQGSLFDFPEPFQVQANESQRLQFNGQLFTNDRFEFNSTLNDQVRFNGRVDLNEQGSKRIHSLNVAVGREQQLQEKPGIYLSGRLEQLDLNEWNQYMDRYFKDDELDSSSLLDNVQSVDLGVRQLSWANQQLRDTHLNLKHGEDKISGSVVSSHMKGQLHIPFKIGPDQPVRADLDYLKLYKSRQKNKIKPDIEDMPNLFISSKLVAFEDLEFKDLTLKTKTTHDKFMINQLDFARDEVKLKSSGHWQFNAATREHVSVFNIAIKGRNFGKAVSGLGLGETIQNGEIDFNGQIGWGGSLYDLHWSTLIGEVNLDLREGYLKNIEPGAGRFVGLLSLNALPKRLFLDFGDVVKEGMQFKRIKGRFTIKGEVMYTDNASMDSSSAKVKIKGSTNLREQTYDQSMIIIPKVGDTLPVIGTLAAGSSVGWGLLLLQKLFKKPIDKSVEIKYRISGSWEDPKIELVEKPQSKAKPKQELIFNNEN